MSLVERVRAESRIGSLKMLAIEANRILPSERQIVGYSRLTLSDLKLLRKKILDAVSENVPSVQNPKIGQLDQIQTLAGLKEMAKLVGLTGYSKYTANQKELLREKIRTHLLPPQKPLPIEPPQPIGKLCTPEKKQSSKTVQIRQVQTTSTISGMVRIASSLGIPNLRSYRLANLEELRQLILKQLQAPFQPNPPIVPLKVVRSNSQESRPKVLGCLISEEEKLDTTPLEDYQNLRLTKFKADTSAQCLSNYGIVKAKKFGCGTYGQTYLAQNGDQETVIKIVDLQESTLGVEGFRWECVIARRAGKLRVGPAVLRAGICYDKTGTASYGIMEMARCKPLGANGVEDEEYPLLKQMIETLHHNGITHRDLGGRNLMRSGKDLVFIDYGLAMAFPGPVPRALALFDFAYLFEDLWALDWIQQQFPREAAELKKLAKNSIYAEEVTARYFPIEMLKTIPLQQAGFFFNKIPVEGSPDDRRITGIIRARLLKERAP